MLFSTARQDTAIMQDGGARGLGSSAAFLTFILNAALPSYSCMPLQRHLTKLLKTTAQPHLLRHLPPGTLTPFSYPKNKTARCYICAGT